MRLRVGEVFFRIKFLDSCLQHQDEFSSKVLITYQVKEKKKVTIEAPKNPEEFCHVDGWSFSVFVEESDVYNEKNLELKLYMRRHSFLLGPFWVRIKMPLKVKQQCTYSEYFMKRVSTYPRPIG
jgi:hypothetical protein